MERMLEIVAPEEVELGSDPVTWWEEFRTVVPISVKRLGKMDEGRVPFALLLLDDHQGQSRPRGEIETFYRLLDGRIAIFSEEDVEWNISKGPVSDEEFQAWRARLEIIRRDLEAQNP